MNKLWSKQNLRFSFFFFLINTWFGWCFLRNMVLKMITTKTTTTKKRNTVLSFGRFFFHFLQQGISNKDRWYSFIILYGWYVFGLFGGLLFEQIKINNIFFIVWRFLFLCSSHNPNNSFLFHRNNQIKKQVSKNFLVEFLLIFVLFLKCRQNNKTYIFDLCSTARLALVKRRFFFGFGKISRQIHGQMTR